MRTGRNSSGFTIVELTVTLVIVGILSVYVVPRLNLQGYEDTRANLELIQGIRYAQSQSLYQTATPGFYITINAGAFTVFDPNGIALADPAAPTAPYVRMFSAGTFGDTGTITFDGRGQPTCTGGLACTAANETIAVADDTITLERFTGFVH